MTCEFRPSWRWAGLALLAVAVQAQTEQPRNGLPDDVHIEQLQHCRDGILDPQARPEDRHRWIDILLSYDTAQGKALVVELMGFAQNREAQQALCVGIAQHARLHPERLDDSYIDPLIDLLGSDSPDLRTASARALSDFPSPEVPTRLGALAVRSDAPMHKRLAAIDALVTKVDNRSVIRELMTLLESGVPEITERVVAALEPVSRETFGDNVERWHDWWEVKSKLSEEAWLEGQLSLYRERMDAQRREARAYREQTQRHSAALATRMGEFQRGVFRSLTPEQQKAKLAEWLSDSLPEVKSVAIELIKARMADEGRRPEGEVLASLVQLLSSEQSSIRREVLEIVQNLVNEPIVVDAVLAQVAVEKDPTLRQAVFRALGKLDSPRAIPAMVLEIADPLSPPDCVREAAISLGSIATRAAELGNLQDAASALKSRYQLTQQDNSGLRSALLEAMAGVADPTFAEEFLGAVESDSPSMIRPAIRGLQRIGEHSNLPRLRTLTAHDDPLVRLAAIEAIGYLGSEEVDIESVLSRLNPTIEPNDLAREAAWGAISRLLARKPVSEQLDYARRMRDIPDLEARYLQGLLTEAGGVNGQDPAADLIRQRLAGVFMEQGKYEEAASQLQQLYEKRVEQGDAEAEAIGLMLLRAVLHTPEQGELVDIATRLLQSSGPNEMGEVIAIIRQYADSPEVAADSRRTRILLQQLLVIALPEPDTAWQNLLEDLEGRLSAEQQEASSAP